LTKQVDFILARAEHVIIFTDLDATLLDHDTYQFDAARPALERVRQEAIPLILTSSKTFEEMVEWHHRLGLTDPFIFENGGGLAFPRNMPSPAGTTVTRRDFRIQLLSPPYEAILTAISPLKSRFRFRGFADLTPEAIAKEGAWASIGVGDSPNDLPMLEAVDIPVVVQRPDGRYLQPLPEHAVRAEGIGPVGWNRAILALIQRWKTLHQ